MRDSDVPASARTSRIRSTICVESASTTTPRPSDRTRKAPLYARASRWALLKAGKLIDDGRTVLLPRPDGIDRARILDLTPRRISASSRSSETRGGIAGGRPSGSRVRRVLQQLGDPIDVVSHGSCRALAVSLAQGRHHGLVSPDGSHRAPLLLQRELARFHEQIVQGRHDADDHQDPAREPRTRRSPGVTRWSNS